MDENALIPKKNEKDKQIFEYLRRNVIEDKSSRPQSAVTGLSSASKMSSNFIKDADPSGFDSLMRSSFYSTKNGGFQE